MKIHDIELDEFTVEYVRALLWSEHGDTDDCEFLDEKYDISDIAPECLKQIAADCEAFQGECWHLYSDARLRNSEFSVAESAAHDFLLTRQGHGAGFWDGDWEEEAGKELTKACKKFKEFYTYVHDGKIYIE